MTSFTEVFRFFLGSISNDYRIKKMFLENQEIAEDMLEVWLMKAIVKFDNCMQNLENFDLISKRFNFILGLSEKVILSDLMILVWMEWNINNITQMNLSLTDGDYKHYAEERNLTGKSNLAIIQNEKVNQDKINYELKNIPPKNWIGGM